MNLITEKHSEKKLAIGMSKDYSSQNEKQSKKQYIAHYADINGKELGPDLLEAHIIALLGNALS